MVPLLLLAAITVISNGQPTGQPPKDECCDTKTVGGVTYTLAGRMDTRAYDCLNPCIYQIEGEAGAKFCFAVGDMKVECNDEGMEVSERPPMGGSERPPMEGSERPPIEGSERPPMEGSERPPMEGSERPPMEGSKRPPMEGSEKPPMEGSEKPTQGGGEVTSVPKPAGCKCGVKKTSRIVGGTETEVNEYPWMSAISDADENQFCGGTLIGSQWVLSASHCFFDQMGNNPTQASTVRIVLGEHDLTTQDESKIPKKVVKVSKIITHPSYNSDTSDNDIALLKLSEEVDLNVYTPACVAKTGETFDGKNAWVYGWGTTASGGQSSDKLLEVEIPVVTNAVCQTALSGQGATITDAMLCAGGQKNKDGCQGDSGGPLTVDVSGQHVLIGDVSYGIGCGQDGLYGVYGNVAYLRSWVDTTVAANGGANYCPA